MQINLRPTHLVFNFGLWLEWTPRGCGLEQPSQGMPCPYFPDFCDFMKGDNPFKVFWMTTTPKWVIGDTILDHHLHIPYVCNLNSSMVLHRGLAVKALAAQVESAGRKWKELFHDHMHFTPVAYHAFNGMLLDMIRSGENNTNEHGEQELILDEEEQQLHGGVVTTVDPESIRQDDEEVVASVQQQATGILMVTMVTTSISLVVVSNLFWWLRTNRSSRSVAHSELIGLEIGCLLLAKT